ncbi:DUF2254 domain-containing protein [Mycolicibacterium sp. ND9-15]|uniref:DUF2254 domain-containing protein n=1 Tax=Mycolicibacterium sp. ND9-15 TaxID=3042320 RepID=UPI002DD9EAE1|nr:DUF2254 domain-containing protein [Mycolicibacterium sp. ND9-15]WSE57361.1 DUF2254 domain-containing protein [Mycolicibacterium sp. ND9-15]
MAMRHTATPSAMRISTALYNFRESLFALPALVLVGGIVLAEVTAYLDDVVGVENSLPLTLEMNSNAAIWLLSTVAGATITTAGVVFSLTVVSLQLASSQFSPRVMRSFIRDRFSQFVIGLLVATFVFCVLTLRHISGEPNSNAPRVSMTAAVVLAVATVLLIIAYLNRLAYGLQVGEVVRTIAAEADAVIDEQAREARTETPARDEPTAEPDRHLTVRAHTNGWVTQAASRYILAAVPPSTTVRLETRTGAYIHRGEVLMTLWPVPSDPERVERKLRSTVEIADIRTMQQDVDFGIRQLVDIALRALSPAINDPTTATDVVLRLGSLMRELLMADTPPPAVRGAGDKVLLRPWDLSHEEYIAHAFEQIRQSSASQPHVVTALARVLRMLIEHARTVGCEQYVPALREQLRLLTDEMAARDDIHPADLERLQAISNDIDPAEHEL